MAKELSKQQAKELKKKVEKAKEELEKKGEELKDTPGNIDAKRELAKKLGAAEELLRNFKFGVLPSPERAAELLENLESNVNIFIKILKAAVEAIKVLIQEIVDILKTLVDGIKSLFPKQKTETAYLGDNIFGTSEISTFVLLNDPIPPDGAIVIPSSFANVDEPIKGRFRPDLITFVVRSAPADRVQYFSIEGLVARSKPTQLGDIKLPPFNLMLDPRRPSRGILEVESGYVSAELNTTMFDGLIYSAQAPIFVRSRLKGIYSPDTGMLRLSSEAIDIASNAPFLEALGKAC